jgi:hypothetical protein
VDVVGKVTAGIKEVEETVGEGKDEAGVVEVGEEGKVEERPTHGFYGFGTGNFPQVYMGNFWNWQKSIFFSLNITMA